MGPASELSVVGEKIVSEGTAAEEGFIWRDISWG